MPCTQEQTKKFPWTAARAAALFRDLRDNYIAKGLTDMNENVDSLSAKYNLKRELIIQGLKTGPARMADDVWIHAQNSRYATQAARRMITRMDEKGWRKVAANLADAPRRGVLFGHFAAFSKSHLSDQLFYNPATYARNFARSWHLATKAGKALHEQRYAEAFSETNPAYISARRAGLILGQSERFLGEVRESTGQVTGKATRSTMAFEELAMRRLEIWERELKKLSPEERANDQQLKDLASVMNHDTGTVARSNAVWRFLFLSPRLLPAQLSHTFVDIPKALFQTGLGVNYKGAAPAMRYVARKVAILASAQTSLLALNYGLYRATGDENFKPDLDLKDIRPSTARIKLFGYSIPTSPTIELLKLPVVMINAAAQAKRGDNRLLDALQSGLKTFLGRQNPLGSLAEQFMFGQNAYSGVPTPFPGLVASTPETKYKKREGYAQWALTELPLPIPAANYLREFFDEAKDHGMPPKDALAWVRLMGIPTFEFATSYHASATYPERPHKPLTPSQRKYQQESEGLIQKGIKKLEGQ